MDATERRRLRELMARLADGDRAAFSPIFEALWPLVRGFVRNRLAGSDADADDTAQQALLNVFARAGEYDAGYDAVAWVLGIAAWEVRTLLRRRSRRREDLVAPALATEAPSPEDAAVSRDLERAAAEVLGTLHANDVETLRAMASGERPPGATFRKRAQRAVERFRTAWRSRHG